MERIKIFIRIIGAPSSKVHPPSACGRRTTDSARPRCSTITRSALARVSGRCASTSRVNCMRLTMALTSRSLATSRWLVASSNTRNFGLRYSAPPVPAARAASGRRTGSIPCRRPDSGNPWAWPRSGRECAPGAPPPVERICNPLHRTSYRLALARKPSCRNGFNVTRPACIYRSCSILPDQFSG